MKYDLIIGGAGLYGATLAHFAHKQGKKVLVLERDEIGGLCADPDGYSKYGPHIFHTNRLGLWEWVNSIAHFVPVHYSPLVQYRDELYSFPINKLTLHQLGYDTIILNPVGRNFEEACVMAVGETLYEKFFYHYTKKMWGREPRDLPSSILKRIPVRSDYRTSYYDDRYVGVPLGGYSNFINTLLDGVEVQAAEFLEVKGIRCVHTGPIDEYYHYRHGRLPGRGIEFQKRPLWRIDAMAINYTDSRPYTREVNYSYLFGKDITIREYPCDGTMYPVPWGVELYNQYKSIPSAVEFEGRQGSYRYLNMNEVIEMAIAKSKTL